MLNLRTKPTVEAGIRHREKFEDGRDVVEYTPGDGTRYLVIISPLTGFSDQTRSKVGIGENSVIVTLASNPGFPTSMVTHYGAFVHYLQVQERLGTTLASSVTLAELLAYLLDGKAFSCEEVQTQYAEMQASARVLAREAEEV